jgi:hypothetical protein
MPRSCSGAPNLVRRHGRLRGRVPAGARRAVSYEAAMNAEFAAPEYDSSGVDVTLIRWMLNLTPAERLQALQGFVDSVWELRGGRDEGREES